jgi:hypothetical protein
MSEFFCRVWWILSSHELYFCLELPFWMHSKRTVGPRHSVPRQQTCSKEQYLTLTGYM